MHKPVRIRQGRSENLVDFSLIRTREYTQGRHLCFAPAQGRETNQIPIYLGHRFLRVYLSDIRLPKFRPFQELSKM